MLGLKNRKYILNFGICMLVFLLALLLLFHDNKHQTRASYDNIATSPTKGLKILGQPSVDQKSLILFLYKNNCKYCKKIEKPVVQEIQKLRGENNKPPFLVLNLNSISPRQKVMLSKNILDLAPNQRLLTPTFALIKSKGNGYWQTLKLYSGTDLARIKKVIGDNND